MEYFDKEHPDAKKVIVDCDSCRGTGLAHNARDCDDCNGKGYFVKYVRKTDLNQDSDSNQEVKNENR